MARSSKYGSLIDCEAPEVARIARLWFPGLWSCFSHIWPLKLKELSCESCDRRKRFFNFCTALWFCFFCNSIRYYVRGPVMVRQCCSCRRPGFFWQSVLALIWPGLVSGLARPGLTFVVVSRKSWKKSVAFVLCELFLLGKWVCGPVLAWLTASR